MVALLMTIHQRGLCVKFGVWDKKCSRIKDAAMSNPSEKTKKYDRRLVSELLRLSTVVDTRKDAEISASDRVELVALLTWASDRVATLSRMDAEAATYVETPIVMRTPFTGETPYVGWRGLGLALREALDERDFLRSENEQLKRARGRSRTGVKVDAEDQAPVKPTRDKPKLKSKTKTKTKAKAKTAKRKRAKSRSERGQGLDPMPSTALKR
jgi:hypothetical protein